MCGIAGILNWKACGPEHEGQLKAAVAALQKRGPDGSGHYREGKICLGHSRLAVIDTSQAATQPMSDEGGRFTIVFNGEIYEHKKHRDALAAKGVRFRTQSDTEVLLQLYIRYGADCLQHLNGQFAFAVWDGQEESLFVARDRLGIKPLLYFANGQGIRFASEMKALARLGVPKEIDSLSLYTYLQLNYIPAPWSIYEGVRKLMPGQYMRAKDGTVELKQYYSFGQGQTRIQLPRDYEDAKQRVFNLAEQAVQRRLVADVPLGTFLSGGIDSSVVTALAARSTKKVQTFTIGFPDEPYYDETAYAQLVADMYSTDHQVFGVRSDDLYAHLHDVLNYIDEPFADSSALPVYILSKLTRGHVTVALSGDGADELFGGYHKHMAHYRALQGGTKAAMVKAGRPIWSVLPRSRAGTYGNLARQLHRFAEGAAMSERERYWRWAAINSKAEAMAYLAVPPEMDAFMVRMQQLTAPLGDGREMNDILRADMNLVLPNDMLTKTDLMSMANSLEVRTPLLDHELVDYVARLPSGYKVDQKGKKKILRDTFRDLLPGELYARPKKGFEVPLLQWFRGGLRPMIENELLDEGFVREQGIFNPEHIARLKKRLFSRSPGEVNAQMWAMVVFQYWWKNQHS